MTSTIEELQGAIEKLAKTRAQKEAIRALERGDTGTVDDIAKSYQQLDLTPRHLKDMSLGGGEAAVDLMMGNPRTSFRKLEGDGKVVRKIYKPDSRLHQGERTRETLDLKQKMTDRARADPSMRPHVANMAGFEEVNPHRFTSFHEYVPGPEIGSVGQDEMLQGLMDIQDKVVGPSDRQRGHVFHDVSRKDTALDMWGNPVHHQYSTVGGGAGNIVMAPNSEGGRTAKIIDFLPIDTNKPGNEGNPTFLHTQEQRAKGLAETPSAWEGKNPTKTMGDLRKEVFQGKGSRQGKKYRVGPAGIPGARAAREAEEAPGLLRRAGSFIAEHPKATAGAALGTLGALGGGYALHRHLKNKAENDNQEQKAASIYSSFFDEAAKIAGFDKEASTRYAREAEKAVETGDRGMLNAIAGAHSQLGLPDRDVTWLGRGGEGSAHLRLGTHPSLPDEKMHVVKYYDPASNVSRGQATTDLLEAKQVATKAMQEEAAKRGGKVIVPSMGSFETKQTPVGLRHRSFHQYLPDIDQEASKRMVDQSTDAMIGAIEGTMNKDPKQVVRSLVGMRNQNLEDVHSVLQGAGKQTGTDVGDVILGRSPLGLMHNVNPGNVVMTERGKPAVLDILPQTKSLVRNAMTIRDSPELMQEAAHSIHHISPQKEFFSPTLRATLPDVREGLAGVFQRGGQMVRKLKNPIGHMV